LAIRANYQDFPHNKVRVIEDIKIVSSPGTPCPFGYWKSCSWDVDFGVDTDGKLGNVEIALCVLTNEWIGEQDTGATLGEKVQEYVDGIILYASSMSTTPSSPAGYKQIGFWNVPGDSYSDYDHDLHHHVDNVMRMYVKKSPRY